MLVESWKKKSNYTTCMTKERRQNIKSCATVWVASLPWPPPGSELRRVLAGRQKRRKKEHEKRTVPCLSLAARLPRPWPRTEWRGRRDGRKANRRAKRDHPGPRWRVVRSGGPGPESAAALLIRYCEPFCVENGHDDCHHLGKAFRRLRHNSCIVVLQHAPKFPL